MKIHSHDDAMNDVQRCEVGEFEMHAHHLSTIPPSSKDRLMTSKSSLFEVDKMIMILCNESLPSYFLHSTKHSKERLKKRSNREGKRLLDGLDYLSINFNYVSGNSGT